MLARLRELDGDISRYLNQTRDILIAETALKNDAVLIVEGLKLLTVVREFGGRAIA